MRSAAEALDYWWSKVISPGPDDCWPWAKSSSYGILEVEGRKVKAHRYAYQTFVGEIPPGMFVCHHCDNPHRAVTLLTCLWVPRATTFETCTARDEGSRQLAALKNHTAREAIRTHHRISASHRMATAFVAPVGTHGCGINERRGRRLTLTTEPRTS